MATVTNHAPQELHSSTPADADDSKQNGHHRQDAPEDADDVDMDDIFEDDDPNDRDPSYNRQRMFNPPTANSQKPSANTFASVDDQVAALSRHATKIRLDSVKTDEERTKDKSDRATTEQVLDQRTRMILLQMINRGVVSEVHGTVSTGKEANVYHAVLQAAGDDQGPAVQRAIKVYKTSIMVFKDRERYIAGEHRFQKGFDKSSNRKMVKLWAEKEFRNMRRIHAAGIPCPEPVTLKLHVLVMGFLGDRRGWAYPRLRDAVIETDDQWRNLYVQLLTIMRRLYQVCRLVHADLSEYNILYNDDTLYIIDVSQSVEPDHPRALEFLRMDIKNVGDFFRRQGVDTLSDRAIFDFITATEGPNEGPALTEAVEKLYETREADEEEEVDNAVFRSQYIPQTLEQVYDIEKDGRKIEQGEGDRLVYKNLLADAVVDKKEEGQEEEEEEDSDSESGDSSSSGAALSGDDSRFDKGRPRGRKHEDKDEKKLHKSAVKEAKREKRKNKIPKAVKKKMVADSSRRHK